MFIQTENTPNPATIKFLPGQNISGRESVEFKNAQVAISSPLAQRLFVLDGVETVFLGSDFVAVTKSISASWESLKPLVLAALMEHLSTGQPIMLEKEEHTIPEIPDDEDEIVKQIRELIDTRVRPNVARDGGDIVFERFEDGIVYLSMRGACSGCPSASATLKMGVENMLRYYVPEVDEVRAI